MVCVAVRDVLIADHRPCASANTAHLPASWSTCILAATDLLADPIESLIGLLVVSDSWLRRLEGCGPPPIATILASSSEGPTTNSLLLTRARAIIEGRSLHVELLQSLV